MYLCCYGDFSVGVFVCSALFGVETKTKTNNVLQVVEALLQPSVSLGLVKVLLQSSAIVAILGVTKCAMSGETWAKSKHSLSSQVLFLLKKDISSGVLRGGNDSLRSGKGRGGAPAGRN